MGQAIILGKTGGAVETTASNVVFANGKYGKLGAIVESSGDSQSQAVASVTQSGNTVVLSSKSTGEYIRMANFLINNGNVVDLRKYSKLVFTMSTSGVTGTYNELRISTSSILPANDSTATTTIASYKNIATSSTTYTVNLPVVNGLYFIFKLQGYYTQAAATVTFTDIHFEE